MKLGKAIILTGLGLICGLAILLVMANAFTSHSSTSTSTPTSESTADTPSPNNTDTSSAPTYTYTSQDAIYSGGTASQVGVAILNVASSPLLYTDLGPRRADGGSFISVGVAVSNYQHSEITMDGGLFELLDDQGNVYSCSDASLSIPNNFFLSGINPGVSKVGTVAFDVPEVVIHRPLRLRFRGGMTGETIELPLEVHKKLLVQPTPQPINNPSPVDSATQQDSQPRAEQTAGQPAENQQTPEASENPTSDQPPPAQPNV